MLAELTCTFSLDSLSLFDSLLSLAPFFSEETEAQRGYHKAKGGAEAAKFQNLSA